MEAHLVVHRRMRVCIYIHRDHHARFHGIWSKRQIVNGQRCGDITAHLSVTCRFGVKTAKHRIMQTMPHDSPTLWVKKTRHLTLAHNFTKYWPIFKIITLLDSVGICNKVQIPHHTLNVSLHYLVKYLCSKNRYSYGVSEANCYARLSHSNTGLK